MYYYIKYVIGFCGGLYGGLLVFFFVTVVCALRFLQLRRLVYIALCWFCFFVCWTFCSAFWLMVFGIYIYIV